MGFCGTGAVFLLVLRFFPASNIPKTSHTQSVTDVTKFSNLQCHLTKQCVLLQHVSKRFHVFFIDSISAEDVVCCCNEQL